MQILTRLALALSLLVAGSARADQSPVTVPEVSSQFKSKFGVSTSSFDDVAHYALNPALRSIAGNFFGASCSAIQSPVPYQWCVSTTGTPTANMYDGTNWVPVFSLSGGGAGFLGSVNQVRDPRSIFNYLSQANINGIMAGDNVDRGAAIQAALTAAGPGNVVFPDGTYSSSQTLLPANGQNIICSGKSFGSYGARFSVNGAGMNAPLIKFDGVGGGGLKGCTLIGNAGSTQVSQILAMINNSNNVTLDDNYYVNGYNAVYVSGTSFYNTLSNSYFGAQYSRQLNVNGNPVGGGVDLIMSNLRFLSGTSTMDYAIYFDGLGSLIADNIQMSVETPGSAAVYFNRPATLFGGVQIQNSVFEAGNGGASAMVVGNASETAWNNIHLINTFLTGGAGSAFVPVNCVRCRITGGVLSSTSSNGAISVPANGVFTNFLLNGVSFDGTGSIVPIQGINGATVSGDIISPQWGGSAPFVAFNGLAFSSVGYLNTFGGYRGSGTGGSPQGIFLPSGGTVPGTRF